MTKKGLKTLMKAEGDFKQFTYLGMGCFAKRGPVKAWCGYVKIPNSHPAFGKDYESLDINVHGGLSFSDVTLPQYPSEKVWYIGFDCSHAGDLCPAMIEYFSPHYDVYRTLEFVESELKRVVDQLIEMALKEEN